MNRSSVLTPLLFAIDNTGVVQWAIEIDPGSGATEPVLAGLAETPSGDILAVGQVHFDDVAGPLPSISGKNAWILRLRPDGTLVAGYALGGTGSEEATRVVAYPDGSYAIGGHLLRAPNVWLAALDATDGLRWSSSYRARPHADHLVDHTVLTGLAAIDDGMLACGTMEPPGTDSWLLRVAKGTGMPVWVKSLIGDAADVIHGDQLVAVVALPVGLAACGRTEVNSVHGDIWVVRTSVDGNVTFLPDSGLACRSTSPEWRRLDLDHDHSTHPLTPTAIAVTVDITADKVLEARPAAAFGQLLTE